MKIRQLIGSPEMGYCKAGCQSLFGLWNLWTFFHMNKTRLVLFLFEPSEASSEKTTRRDDPHGLERSSWFPWFPWFANLPVVRVLDSLMGRSWDQSTKEWTGPGFGASWMALSDGKSMNIHNCQVIFSGKLRLFHVVVSLPQGNHNYSYCAYIYIKIIIWYALICVHVCIIYIYGYLNMHMNE